MKYAYLYSIEESPFLNCVSAPTEDQIASVVASLARSDNPEAPWVSDPHAWVRQRFAQPDWYSDLDDPVVWELAITQLLQRPEFGFQYSGSEKTLLSDVVDWSQRAFKMLGESAVLGHFKPYRYHLSEEQELQRFYWPSHALISNEGVGRLLGELARLDSLLEMMEQTPPPGFHPIRRDEMRGAYESVEVSIPVLEEIRAQGRMLYAPFEI